MLNYFWVALFALCLGSFLNVVIYRLPRNANFIVVRSACTRCHHTLCWHHNIPILSFIFLKARCAFCHTPISWRYPFVETLTVLIGVLLYYKFGFSYQFMASSIFSLLLIILIFIDIDHQLLPDSLTFPLLWLGLIASLFSVFINSHDAIIGAIVGYLSLWSIANLYKLIRHEDGMGHGDFKLLAALGAWIGWQHLLQMILIASISGLIVGLYLLLTKKIQRQTPIPFGPFLAIAGWISLIYYF